MRKIFFLLSFILISFFIPKVHAATTIDSITAVTTGNIEKYSKFETSFKIKGSTYSNPYFPYSSVGFENVNANAGGGVGVSVDSKFLSPLENDWGKTKYLPCFYFQPYDPVHLTPQGPTDWRCRFTPDIVGTWKYKIYVRDKNGTVESGEYSFNVINSANKGFIRISPTDSRFFEFSDGTPFQYPLVTIDPFYARNGDYKTLLYNMGKSGLKFTRWFPNGENGGVNPWSDTVRSSWMYGPAYNHADFVDTARNKNWSFGPYYYSTQYKYLKEGTYKFSLRAFVNKEMVLFAGVGGKLNITICSETNSLDKINCNLSNKKSGWNEYVGTFNINKGEEREYVVNLNACYQSVDAPSPCNQIRVGDIRVSDIKLQRDETGNGGWGGNYVTKGDSQTFEYVDQNEAAKLDEIFRLSEEYGVYHKLSVFHKNDQLLNAYSLEGIIQPDYGRCDWGYCPINFYSSDNKLVRWLWLSYVRYFVARWGYSPAIHSLEMVNESEVGNPTNLNNYDALYKFIKFVKDNSSRNILTTASFWGYWNDDFFNKYTKTDHPEYNNYIPLVDYGDVHWYTNRTSTGFMPISSLWQDTVANVRQCYNYFREVAGNTYKKPIVRGETGLAADGTQPQDPAIAKDITGTYYHKKLWAHVGLLGYSCDGEWYPRIFDGVSTAEFPTSTNDLYKIYSTYDKFINNEPRNNGTHVELGTDLLNNNKITSSNSVIRAFGSKDPITSRLLVWVDNKNNTWQNPNYSTSATSILTISGMPQGTYTQETWDTRSATFTKTDNAITVSSNGVLSFSVTTAKDTAYKFYIQGIVVPSPTPTISPTPNPLDVNDDNVVNLSDILVVLNHIFTGTTPNTKYDVNSDTKIDLLDIITIINAIFN